MNRAGWALVAEGTGRHRLASTWASACGPEMVAAWLEAGLLSALPARPGAAWPCAVNAAPGCARRVVARGDELIAACGLAPASCAAERLEPDARLLVVDRAVLLARLAEALGLEARVEDRGGPGPVLLGEGRIAEARIRYLWLDRPRWTGLEDALFRVASGSRLAALVLVVAHPSQVPAGAPPEIAGVRVFWLALADAASWEDRRLRVDRSELILGLNLPVDLGPLLWPRYALVIDQRRDQVWYGGMAIRLPALPAQLLQLIARNPAEILRKRDAILTLWDLDIPARGRLNLDAFDARLRQVRLHLSRAFTSVPTPLTLPSDPVETVKSQDDRAAGFRLRLRANQVKVVA